MDLGRWTVVYHPAGSAVEALEPIGNFDEAYDRLFVDHERLRRVLIRLLPGWSPAYYLLHWSDGTDLRALDRRLVAGEPAGVDFEGALVVEPRTSTCDNCGVTSRLLAPDTGFPVFAEDLARRLREHRFIKTCPQCGKPLHPYAVEVLDTLVSDGR